MSATPLLTEHVTSHLPYTPFYGVKAMAEDCLTLENEYPALRNLENPQEPGL